MSEKDKSGDLTAFRIELGSSNGVYREGERVTGSVVVELGKAMTLRAIRLQVKGRAVWGEESSKKAGEVEKVYVNRDIVLLERPPGQPTAGEWDWEAGRHVLPFECPLPKACPSSFEGAKSFVRYFARAVLHQRVSEKASKDKRFLTKAPFTVLGPPPATIPDDLLKPATAAHEAHAGACCCLRGKVRGDLSLQKSVFVAGESVYATLHVENKDSRKSVDSIKVSIVECLQKQGSEGGGVGAVHKRSLAEATLDKSSVAGGGRWEAVNLELLKVPAVAPSFRIAGLYGVSYELAAEAGKSLRLALPLTIGNIPLSQDGAPPPTGFQTFVLGPKCVKDTEDGDKLFGGSEFAPLYPVFEGSSLSYPNPSPTEETKKPLAEVAEEPEPQEPNGQAQPLPEKAPEDQPLLET